MKASHGSMATDELVVRGVMETLWSWVKFEGFHFTAFYMKYDNQILVYNKLL